MKNVFCLSLILLACNVPEFKNYSELGELRLVGIVADNPVIDGTRTDDVQVTLTPYLSDFNARGREFTVVVAGCLATGRGQGASLRCARPQLVTYPNNNTFDTAVLAEDNYTGAMDAVTITIANPAQQIAAFSPQQRVNGIDYLVVFRLEHAASKTNLSAVKVISISEQQDLNNNPEIEKIVLDEEALSQTCVSVDIGVSFTAAGAQEIYREMSAEGGVAEWRESYVITWFYLGGRVTPSRVLFGQRSRYSPDSSATTLVAVVKDRRGGTAVAVKQLPACRGRSL